MNPEHLIEKYKHLSDFHLTRIMGSWVVVSQGSVVEVDRTHALQRCPLQSMLIFAYTSRGIALLAAYSDESGAEILRGLDPNRQYLLAATGSSTRILLGELQLALSEVLLPVRSANEPSPLD
jgi:hypothetical protein